MSQTWNGTKKETPERRTYTVDDIAQILGIGRTSAYILVKEGHFKIVRIGNAIRISKRCRFVKQIGRRIRK
ncbi:helix-turn-helix domain-containing protein, partial [Flavonifractor plautii]